MKLKINWYLKINFVRRFGFEKITFASSLSRLRWAQSNTLFQNASEVHFLQLIMLFIYFLEQNVTIFFIVSSSLIKTCTKLENHSFHGF